MKTSFTPEQLAHLRKLVKTGYLPTIEKVAKRLTAPFWWRDTEQPPGNQIIGGTICFVHTGDRLLGITAAHVHTEYLRRRKENHDISGQIGGHSFDPEARIVDISESVDLVTYEISEIQVNAARADVHHAPMWPPVVDNQDAYILGGWLWSLCGEGNSTVTHSFFNIIACLSRISDQNLSVLTYTSKSIPWGRNALPPGTKLGGMSGGPLYRINESGLSFITLVGIIYEYQPSYEIILARPLSLIDPKGYISKGAA